MLMQMATWLLFSCIAVLFIPGLDSFLISSPTPIAAVSGLKQSRVLPVLNAVRDNKDNEMRQILGGINDLTTGRALNFDALNEIQTSEDIITMLGLLPMVATSVNTALSGAFDPVSYALCAGTAFLTSFAHFSFVNKVPRDLRAPRLGDEATTHEYSAWYLLAFSWLLFRINPLFPPSWTILDIPMATSLTVVIVYGVAYAALAKSYLPSKDGSRPGADFLLPSSPEFVEEVQLLLSGNAAINVLAFLFIPFTWTLCLRGTEWWERVQQLHPNQGAFMAISILVATIGDISGIVALRIFKKKVINSAAAIVLLGLVSNFLLLIAPEIVFNLGYGSGVSEVLFYWE